MLPKSAGVIPLARFSAEKEGKSCGELRKEPGWPIVWAKSDRLLAVAEGF
jgi:hypothetical protein